MKLNFETELRSKLNELGASKLPASVYGALITDISADMQLALKKSLSKRTKARALARVFAECVSGQWARDSKGHAVPFGQLHSGQSQIETSVLIGTNNTSQG